MARLLLRYYRTMPYGMCGMYNPSIGSGVYVTDIYIITSKERVERVTLDIYNERK